MIWRVFVWKVVTGAGEVMGELESPCMESDTGAGEVMDELDSPWAE